MGYDADSLAMIQAEHDLMPVVPILLLTGVAGSTPVYYLSFDDPATDERINTNTTNPCFRPSSTLIGRHEQR